MAGAIKALDQDEQLRLELRARGRERAQLFSPVQYQNKISELYGTILGVGRV